MFVKSIVITVMNFVLIVLPLITYHSSTKDVNVGLFRVDARY